MTLLTVRALTLKARTKSLVEAASFVLRPGEFVVLLGPNGAGKTSLIRASLGLDKPDSGLATLCGENTRHLSPIRRARSLAYLPQNRPLAWPAIVRDVVALGRFSHGATPGRLKQTDAAAVERALTACDLIELAHRRTDTLSGGELARMHCARALATEAPLLIADEPDAGLDVRHRFRIMELIADYVAKGGGALVILHDIEMAARYASRLIWMKDGHILADGSVSQTLTEERLQTVYGIRAQVKGQRINMTGPAR